MGTATTIAHVPMRTWQSLLAAALTLLALAAPAAAQTFPALSGRVVDQAQVLDPGVRAELAAKLRALETQTSHQLVIATVTSLEGRSVEDYANRLFRAWRLGHKDKNDGVLFLLAPTERKVRIEVGYGLEGVLPDAIAKLIIEDAIVPQLRAGEVNAAVMAGANQIIGGLVDGGAQWKRIMQARAPASPGPRPWWQRVNWNLMLPLIIIPLFIFLRIFFPKYADPVPASGPRGSSRDWDRDRWSDSSSSSSSDSSDSFSGGGGSSGGGGASGSW